jgi:hypothetical protein
MKKLLILALLLNTSCAAIAPVGVYKFSQAANHASGGKDTETLTEDSYQRCKTGDAKACFDKHVYTAIFFPIDRLIALTIDPSLIASSHGAIWHEVDKKLPQISKVCDSYGGHKYNGGCE